jgi:hypothetical protein
MPRYYFPSWDGDTVYPDHRGVEFDSFEQARTAALRSLGEMALYSLPRSPKERILKVQVKDGGDDPLVELRLVFESIDGT